MTMITRAHHADVKPVVITNPVTPSRFVSQRNFRTLVSTDNRGLRDSFVEAWIDNHAGEIPVVYFHNNNAIMSAYFRQILPDSLQIGCTSRSEYDPLRDIPVPQFFSHVISRDTANHGKISIAYLKGIASLLLLDKFEPTLYRINTYANRNLGSVIRRHEDELDEDTYAVLNRCMNRSESSIENTLDYLDMMCDACGSEINQARRDQGKSIYSALRSGSGVSIDVSKITSNPVGANLVFAQLDYARTQGVPYSVILDLEYVPETISSYIMNIGSSTVCLALTSNVWAMGNSEFVQNILSSREGSIFVPNGNMTACHDISLFLDTYWKEQETTTISKTKGKNRRALTILPMYANGEASAVAVAKVKDSVMSANDLRQLSYNTAVAVLEGVKEIVVCELACC